MITKISNPHGLRLLNKSLQLDPHNKLQKTSSEGTFKIYHFCKMSAPADTTGIG